MTDMRKGTGALCGHKEIIAATPGEFYGDLAVEAEAAVTYHPRAILPGRNFGHPYGLLRMYVCRSCGFTQTFAENPEEIPIGEKYKTRKV